MALVTWRRGWGPFQELEREMGRLFESMRPIGAWRAARQYPALNLYELDDQYVLTAELPGVSKEDLDLSIAGQVLTLTAQRRPRPDVPPEIYRRRERPIGDWTRSISLPDRVDAPHVTAEFAAGILRVHMPKTVEAKPRQIPIAAD